MPIFFSLIILFLEGLLNMVNFSCILWIAYAISFLKISVSQPYISYNTAATYGSSSRRYTPSYSTPAATTINTRAANVSPSSSVYGTTTALTSSATTGFGNRSTVLSSSSLSTGVSSNRYSNTSSGISSTNLFPFASNTNNGFAGSTTSSQNLRTATVTPRSGGSTVGTGISDSSSYLRTGSTGNSLIYNALDRSSAVARQSDGSATTGSSSTSNSAYSSSVDNQSNSLPTIGLNNAAPEGNAQNNGLTSRIYDGSPIPLSSVYSGNSASYISGAGATNNYRAPGNSTLNTVGLGSNSRGTEPNYRNESGTTNGSYFSNSAGTYTTGNTESNTASRGSSSSYEMNRIGLSSSAGAGSEGSSGGGYAYTRDSSGDSVTSSGISYRTSGSSNINRTSYGTAGDRSNNNAATYTSGSSGTENLANRGTEFGTGSTTTNSGFLSSFEATYGERDASEVNTNSSSNAVAYRTDNAFSRGSSNSGSIYGTGTSTSYVASRNQLSDDNPSSNRTGRISYPQEESSAQPTSTTTSSPFLTERAIQPPSNDPFDDPDPMEFPDSPYHNYAYYNEPFSSTYSTHSYYENYGTEYTNRYYHDERVPPRQSYFDYQRRREQSLASRREEPEENVQIGIIKAEPRQNGLIPTNLLSHTWRQT